MKHWKEWTLALASLLVLSGCQHGTTNMYSGYFYVTSTDGGYVCQINDVDVTKLLSIEQATSICRKLNQDITGNEDIPSNYQLGK